MTGKNLLILFAALLVAVGTGGAAVIWSVAQVPDFYEQALAEPPDPASQKEAAETFVARTVQLVDDIKYADAWSQEFDARQINAWLANELPTKYADVVPPGIRDPRVGFDDKFVLVGFRYQSEKWQGVVSLKLRPWVAEPNKLAIEVASIRAGVMPIPLESVIEQLSQRIETDGWRAEWSEVDGHDVLIVHFDGGDEDQPVLETVQVAGKALQISGSGPSSRQPLNGESPGRPDGIYNVSRAGSQSAVK